LARADEPIIVSLILNQQKKGDFFVILRENGDFLIKTPDLEKIGFLRFPGEQIGVAGETFVSLASMRGVAFHFDEPTLTLEITSAPELLSKTTLDLAPARRANIIYPRDNSVFLNYGVDYTAGGDSFTFKGLTVSNELGLRLRDILLLTDSIYTETPDESLFVRLNSSLTWDQRDSMRRFVAGDFFAFSGSLGSSVNMGGLSFAKIFRIDPYFIRYPLFDFAGQLLLPSEVELYLDGMLRQSEHFAPGEFELRNFQSIGGAQTVEIVIRDAFGRERRIISPFYFTDQILRKGVHEYSYNLGLLRDDFGQESNHYRDLAFSGFHRYGVSDTLNLGLRGEAGGGLLNVGTESTLKVGILGLLRFEAAASREGDESGTAGLLNYDFQSRTLRARLGLQGFSEKYRTLSDTDGGRRRKIDLRAGIGYVIPSLGSFGIDYFRTEAYNRSDQETLTFSWSRRLWKEIFINSTLSQVRENDTEYAAVINLSWNFSKDHSLSASYRHEQESDIRTVEARRNTPSGEGTGWQVRGERSQTEESESHLFNAFVQHNARHAIVQGEYSQGRSESIATEDLRATVSGALVYLGGTVGLIRPVTDSFSLVTVGEAEKVRVYSGNQTVGRTDSQGQAFVPNLTSYYENQISIEDKDIPLDYLMPKVKMLVSPPLRSGSCINFPLRKYQAFTGTFAVQEAEGIQPLDYAELTLDAPGGKMSFWTGGEGEFYFDSQQMDFDMSSAQGCETVGKDSRSFLPPGIYPVSIRHGEMQSRAEITIPDSEETFVELGEILWKPGQAESVGRAIAPPSAENIQGKDSGRIPSSGPEQENSGPPPLPLSPPPEIPEASSLDKPELIHKYVIRFPFDRDSPTPEEQAILDMLVQVLVSHPELPVAIEGHTSAEGSERYNLRLGLRRARAIKNHLLAAGIAESRIIRVVSFGEKRPACREFTEECFNENRRTVLILAK
jgi:outer membrane usher protein FimD/PapC/outer membrane protein OmpA-like peptidoglycan-associated protein